MDHIKKCEYLSWTNLANLGKNKIVNRTYIYLILVPFLVNSLHSFGLTNPLELVPYSWKLFFFSSLAFYLGSLIFSIYAPTIIKDNSTFADFELSGKNYQHLNDYQYRLKLDVEKFQQEFEQVFNKKFSIDVLKAISVSDIRDSITNNKTVDIDNFDYWIGYYQIPKATWPKLIAESNFNPTAEENNYYEESLAKFRKENNQITFWSLYNYANYYRFYMRLVCGVLFLAGLIQMIIVVIKSILTVVN